MQVSAPPVWNRWIARLRDHLAPRLKRPSHRASPRSPWDTVMHWPPSAVRPLGTVERVVHTALAAALQIEHPQGYLLAHLPLPRLVRVPVRRSYKEWLSRTGHLTVDFVLCDALGQPWLAVLLEHPDESPRAQRQRDRIQRVLLAAEIPVLSWRNGWQTDPKALRAALLSAARPARTRAH